MSHKPLRIAVEGIDGVGKSTVIRAIQALLGPELSISVRTMAPTMLRFLKQFGLEHFGDPTRYWTEVSRRTKTQLFLTEGVVRAGHLYEADVISGIDVIIYDRWWETFSAYSDHEDDFDARCRFLASALPVLDATFYLRGHPIVCAQRLRQDDDWLAKQMADDALEPFLTTLSDRYDGIMGPRKDVELVEATTPDRAAALIAQVINRLVSTRAYQRSDATAGLSTHLSSSSPVPTRIYALEGVDGSGKSTVATEVARIRDDIATVHRLSSVTLELFKKSAVRREGEQASAAIRREFDDEFRQQTYIVDGLVQLDCLAQTGAARGPMLFDRWFPHFGLFQDHIVTDRALFDYLLNVYPVPDRIFYLDIDAVTAVERLSERGDWMLELLGRDGTKAALQQMLDRQHPAIVKDHRTVSLLDGSLPLSKLIERVSSGIPR